MTLGLFNGRSGGLCFVASKQYTAMSQVIDMTYSCLSPLSGESYQSD